MSRKMIEMQNEIKELQRSITSLYSRLSEMKVTLSWYRNYLFTENNVPVHKAIELMLEELQFTIEPQEAQYKLCKKERT